jgi:molybdopterin-guanine dinucleotide biosynthesis protein A
VAAVYHHGVESITGFVLAGGKSSRMGQDKAFLRLNEQTLLARALELVRSATGSSVIVGGTKKFAGLGSVVEDIFPGQGPLAGIHAALAGSSTDLNLVLAVDMPFVETGFLTYLVSQARKNTEIAVVPMAGGRLQPLCAIYRKNFAAVAEKALRVGENKIGSLFADIKTRVIESVQLERAGFDQAMFRNLNTEQDWKEAAHKSAVNGI